MQQEVVVPTARMAEKARGQQPLVELSGVSKVYETDSKTLYCALRNVDFQVFPGELIAFVGPSGSGKSTLLHLVGGLDRATSGRVRVLSKEISALDDTEFTILRRESM